MSYANRILENINRATGNIKESGELYGFSTLDELENFAKSTSMSMYYWCDENGRDPMDYPLYSDGGEEGMAAKAVLAKIGDYHTLIDLDEQEAASYICSNGVDPDIAEDFVCALFADKKDPSRWV